MKYYTIDGGVWKRGLPKYYKSKDGNIVPLPNSRSTKEELLNYLEICIGANRQDVERGWNYYETKLPKIKEYLADLQKYYNSTGDRFRASSYAKALRTINGLNVPIVSGKQAVNFQFIGKGIADKIQEILDTDHLKFVDEKLQGDMERSKILQSFESISGVGSATAIKWYDMGIRSITDVNENKDKLGLTYTQNMGLRYYYDFLERIPRSEIASAETMFRSILEEVDPKAKFILCGSYLRGNSTSGDIDILIGNGDKDVLVKYVEALEKIGVIIERMNLQDPVEKFYGVAKLNGVARRIDISWVPIESWWTGVMHCTGSGSFNEKLRSIALKKGMHLTEKGVTLKDGSVVHPSSEKEIFKILGEKWVPAEGRNI